MESEGSMILTSRAFKNGDRIPPKYTQDGQGAKNNMSPPLEWYNVPEDTVCLVLIMEDPNPQMDGTPVSFCHWYVSYRSTPSPSHLLCGSFCCDLTVLVCMHAFGIASMLLLMNDLRDLDYSSCKYMG